MIRCMVPTRVSLPTGLSGSQETAGAAQGAIAGAAAGTAVLPVIGTIIGGIVGAVGGYLGGKAGAEAQAKAAKQQLKIAQAAYRTSQNELAAAQAQSMTAGKSTTTWLLVAAVGAVALVGVAYVITKNRRRRS